MRTALARPLAAGLTVSSQRRIQEAAVAVPEIAVEADDVASFVNRLFGLISIVSGKSMVLEAAHSP